MAGSGAEGQAAFRVGIYSKNKSRGKGGNLNYVKTENFLLNR